MGDVEVDTHCGHSHPYPSRLCLWLQIQRFCGTLPSCLSHTVCEAVTARPLLVLCARRSSYRIPHGESVNDKTERIARVFTDLARRHVGEKIVVVTHGGVVGTLHDLLTGRAPKSQVSNCSISIVRLSASAGLEGALPHKAYDGVAALPHPRRCWDISAQKASTTSQAEGGGRGATEATASARQNGCPSPTLDLCCCCCCCCYCRDYCDSSSSSCSSCYSCCYCYTSLFAWL